MLSFMSSTSEPLNCVIKYLHSLEYLTRVLSFLAYFGLSLYNTKLKSALRVVVNHNALFWECFKGIKAEKTVVKEFYNAIKHLIVNFYNKGLHNA